MERAARHRVSAAGGTPQLDRVVSQSARREEREADRRRAETGGLDHRLGVRFPEGGHHPHRAHGRPHRGRARSAPGPARRARGVPYRVAVADHVAQARHIPWAAEAMRRGEWDRKRFEGTELRGKTIGIVGLGRIGGHVAQLARAFGMHVVGHDPYLSPERAADLQLKLLPLDQLLRQADVVTLHLAHTEQTHHLINDARLKLMKPTAVLVNTARGELVDAVALAEAIGEKRIGGAALDVFAVEPLPADSPLRKLERVILTPHLAASTAEAQERVSLEICGAVRDALLAGDLSFAINVPGISGDLLRRLGPLLDLARRLGRLALALVDGPVTAVEVDYGGKDEAAPRPVLMAAVEGLLS